MPMDGMNYVEYLQRANTAGKVTSRSILEVLMIVCTALEEQEARNVQNEANFAQIEEILKKLIAKNGTPTSPLGQSVPEKIEKHPVESMPQVVLVADVTVEEPVIPASVEYIESAADHPDPIIRTPKVKKNTTPAVV